MATAGTPPRPQEQQGPRSGGGLRPRRDRPRYIPKRRVCAFCADKSKTIDFRDPAKLRRYISDRGKIESRRKTATCAKHQREMAEAIKRARHLALLPYTIAHVRLIGGTGFRPPMMARQAPAPQPQAQAQEQTAAPAAAGTSAAPAPAPEAQAPAAQAPTEGQAGEQRQAPE